MKYTRYYKPMLATLSSQVFDDKDWLFEIKWDGYRAIAEWTDKKLRLYSRNGLAFEDKYPLVADAVKKIKHNVVLDGEIVALDEQGRPSFQKLQQYDHNPNIPLVYYVFDIILLDKKDLRHLPLVQRKELLYELLKTNKNPVLQYCDHVEQHGRRFLDAAVQKGLEGVIAKKCDSEYNLGIRSKEWLKIKNRSSKEGVIVGYTKPRNSRKHFGALVLGEYGDDGELKYMGHTGTGFDEKTLKELWQQMQPLVTDQSPFKTKVRVNMPVTWVKPKLVCELYYTEETDEGALRHPVFKGLRPDKNKQDVKKKDQQPVNGHSGKKEQLVSVNGHQLALTNLSKEYWPQEHITKGDVIAYYDMMAGYILPYLKNRPLSLKRNPNGILDEGFYHKDAGVQAPEWVKKFNVRSESDDKIVHYIMCNDKATLLYIANLGSIEINPWNSTSKKPGHPTYMIIDIDPSPKNSFEEVIETAQVVKGVLDRIGAEGFCKTSGATGLHVYIPMGAKYEYDQVRDFGHIVASLTAEQLPKTTSLERSLKKRGNKIYVDYLQNSKGQTLASVYSLRPKEGATVSTPLLWKEVKKGLHPAQFNIKNIHKRLSKTGDLFSGVLKKGIDLKKCLKLLGA